MNRPRNTLLTEGLKDTPEPPKEKPSIAERLRAAGEDATAHRKREGELRAEQSILGARVAELRKQFASAKSAAVVGNRTPEAKSKELSDAEDRLEDLGPAIELVASRAVEAERRVAGIQSEQNEVDLQTVLRISDEILTDAASLLESAVKLVSVVNAGDAKNLAEVSKAVTRNKARMLRTRTNDEGARDSLRMHLPQIVGGARTAWNGAAAEGLPLKREEIVRKFLVDQGELF